MDFSGIGINKTFKSGQDPEQPYYYVSASLDLSGRASGTYYFTQDNNYDYAFNREYKRFIILDNNALISEVSVFANNDLVEADGETPQFWIGGAPAPSATSQVMVPWAAPSGDAPGLGSLMDSSDINAGAVHLFGHEGGHEPYYVSPNNYKYLAISINPDVERGPGQERSSLPKRSKRQLHRGLPEGDPQLLEGKVSVSIKVYPKIQ
jgi:hypothetical protein